MIPSYETPIFSNLATRQHRDFFYDLLYRVVLGKDVPAIFTA